MRWSLLEIVAPKWGLGDPQIRDQACTNERPAFLNGIAI